MSYSIDANILLYAANESSDLHSRAVKFLRSRMADSELMILTYPTLFAFCGFRLIPESSPARYPQIWPFSNVLSFD